MLKVRQLYVNYETAPIGVETPLRFHWVMDSDKRGVMQQSYCLQIALDGSFEHIIAEQEKETDASVGIRIEESALLPHTRYFARVRVAEKDGEASEYSDAVSFVTAPLLAEFDDASFITVETKEDAKNSKSTYLRRKFSIGKKIKSAYICATAHGVYELYLDGNKVGNDYLTPGWTSYHKHLMYQMYDITEQMTEGGHCVGAMLGAGWYKGVMGFLMRPNNYGEIAEFMCKLFLEYEDGTTEELVTDAAWEGTDGPVVFGEIYDGEIYDAAKEINDWCCYDGIEGQWKQVTTAKVDSGILASQYASRTQMMDELPAKKVWKDSKGRTVIDFGQNMTGWPVCRVKGKQGEQVEFSCFETLDKNGDVYTENLRLAKQSYTYTFKKDEEAEIRPHFTFMGYRYVWVKKFPCEVTKEHFISHTLHSNMRKTGEFECSNPDINQLQSNITWSLKGNFLDIPTDCPQRNERLGWTGDAQIFCRTACYLMQSYHFFEKWLRDVKEDQTPEGGVSHVVPDILTGVKEASNDWLVSNGTHSAAAWGDVAVINPWNIYLTYGDTQILLNQYESMRAWIEFMRSHSEGHIWTYRLQFGDWVALDAEEGSYFGATPLDITCTAYYAYSTGLFAKIASILGKEEDAKEYRQLEQEIIEVFRTRFFDEEGNMTAQTQTAHIVALYFNLVPEKYREKTVNNLVKLLEKENGHLVTGFVGTPYFTHALSRNGKVKEAYELLLKDDFPSWLFQIKMGATTIWEHWDGMKADGSMWSPDMNSFNHYSYGSIGEWLYRVMAGIEIDEEKPGYKHSLIQPKLSRHFDYVKASYDSSYGKIGAGWKLNGNVAEMDVTVPVNTTATISLDGFKSMIDACDICFEAEDGLMKGTAGSGTYHIVYEWEEG